MTTYEQMTKRHEEMILTCRDELAMQLDPGAFKPPNMTGNLIEYKRQMSKRQADAFVRATKLMRDILVVLDLEYAVYYADKNPKA